MQPLGGGLSRPGRSDLFQGLLVICQLGKRSIITARRHQSISGARRSCPASVRAAHLHSIQLICSNCLAQFLVAAGTLLRRRPVIFEWAGDGAQVHLRQNEKNESALATPVRFSGGLNNWLQNERSGRVRGGKPLLCLAGACLKLWNTVGGGRCRNTLERTFVLH